MQLVGTLVVFSGMVQFENNRHHSEGLSGALYLSSFGQMLLEENATLNFTGNLGRFVICIVLYILLGRAPPYEINSKICLLACLIHQNLFIWLKAV